MEMPMVHFGSHARMCVGVSLLAVSALSACQKEAPVLPAPPTPEVVKEIEPRQQDRNVFGVPLPPRVRSVTRQAREVWVETDMNIDALERFYKEELKRTDFEVVRVLDSLRIIGLRPMTALVRASYIRGNRSNVRMLFVPSHRLKTSSMARASTPEDVAAAKKAQRESSSSRDFGKPVKLTTPEGDLLAPGAVWGKPYYPPKGSPLHKREFKVNWGLPLEKWQGG